MDDLISTNKKNWLSIEERKLLDELEGCNINTDITSRWENGIEHHPKSYEIVKNLQRIDWMFCGGHFDWEIGGDGDNGETLMYELDILFELLDAKTPQF